MDLMIPGTPMRFGLREKLEEARAAFNDAAREYLKAKTPTERQAAKQKVHVARSRYLDVRVEVAEYRQEMKALDEKDQYKDWKKSKSHS